MKKIYLIDWNSFIYRMFFALPEFATKDWRIVNAVFWMAKFFVWQLVKENPDYLIFIKDAKWDNFRHKIYADYKATRDRMPDNLRSQISLIEEMIAKMWIDIVEIDWFEADDVIWTLATNLWVDKNNDIYILSWDKDLYSLTKTNVKIYDTMKWRIYDYDLAKTKFDVNPEYIIDYLAIVWDTSDNIPGIDWFWPKKAVDLINKYWTIENIFEHINDEDFVLSWKTLEKLHESKEIAFLSKQLATIDLNVDIPWFNLWNFLFDKDKILNNEVINLFRNLEFSSLVWEEKKDLQTWEKTGIKVNVVKNKKELDNLKWIIKKYERVFLDTETTSLEIHEAKLVWVSIFLDEENVFYINHLHVWEQVESSDLKEFLNDIFALDIEIVGHNLKYDLEIINLFLSDLDAKESQVKIDLWSWQISLGI